MKRILFNILFFAMLITTLPLIAGNGNSIAQRATLNPATCMQPNNTFSVGEKLEFDIYYNWTAVWVKAGKVNFGIQSAKVDGTEALHMEATGKSAKAFNWFYKVADRYETYMDANTMLPLKFERSINEGGFTERGSYKFYHDQNKAYVDYRYRKGDLKQQDEWVDMESCSQDLLSVIYYARNLDYSSLNPGDLIPFNLFYKDKNYPVSVRYLGKENVKTDLGTFRCAKFAPSLIKGDYFGDSSEDMSVYITDDGNKLPILIETPIVVGFIKAYLTNFDGLRYPMASKIE